MNPGEIAERFIRAAEIDLHHTGPVGPARLKSLSLPYVHDQADKNGWGTERLAEERREFWEKMSGRPTAADISEADRTRSWLAHVPDADQRSALLAWADSQAGAGFFKDWCFRNGIHPMTGTRRKDRALEAISRTLSRSVVQNCDSGQNGVLPEPRENGDIEPNIASRAQEKDGILSWFADDAFRPFIFARKPGTREIETGADFSWAQKRNELRRQREARKRKAA